MSPTLTVKYFLTEAMARDAASHFGQKVTGASPWTFRVIAWVLLTLPIRWLLSLQLMKTSSKGEQLGVAAAISAAFVGLQVWKARRAVSKIEPQEVTLLFSESGVEKRVLHSESRLEWKAYESFTETDKYFLLCYANRTADIVPKEAFVSPQDAEAFRSLLASRVRSSAGDPHPILGRTRLIFYILLIAAVILLFVAAKFMHPTR